MTPPAPDVTHDPALRSWVPGADGHADFPIQNLPLGVFAPSGQVPRGGVAIGDRILDLPALAAAGMLDGAALAAAGAAAAPTLNALLALGPEPRRALRTALSALLAEGSAHRAAVAPHLREAGACALQLPAAIGDYTDFYAGVYHAENVGRLFRPEAPLPPNYRYVPIGYHGRASSVRVSGAPVVRPRGQARAPDEAVPRFGPTARLDHELELGLWIGPGNGAGVPIPVGDAHAHVAGYCLLNDWSARDVQAWEYQPLGPFLAKSFATTVSPWVITPEALAPFRLPQPPRGPDDPAPLPYLWDAADQAAGALGVVLEVLIETAAMRARGLPPHRLTLSDARHLYWTPAQLVAHHASNGCDLRPGDLLGTGTISAPGEEGFGSLLEATRGGRDRVALPSGETRAFLEDGDAVILRARAARPGFVSIGFGECRGRVGPAPD